MPTSDDIPLMAKNCNWVVLELHFEPYYALIHLWPRATQVYQTINWPSVVVPGCVCVWGGGGRGGIEGQNSPAGANHVQKFAENGWFLHFPFWLGESGGARASDVPLPPPLSCRHWPLHLPSENVWVPRNNSEPSDHLAASGGIN